MDKVKKNFWLIFLFLGVNFAIFSIFFLFFGVNLTHAQTFYTVDKEYIPMNNVWGYPEGGCILLDILNVGFFRFYNFASICRRGGTQANWFMFPVEPEIKFKNVVLQMTSNNPTFYVYGDLTKITKIHILKVKNSQPQYIPDCSSGYYCAPTYDVYVSSTFPNDVILTIDDIDIRFLGLDAYGRKVFRSYNQARVVKIYNKEFTLNTERFIGFMLPKETIVFLAEGVDNNNELKYGIITGIYDTTNDENLILYYYDKVGVYINFPAGMYNPDNYNNTLKFLLFRGDNMPTTTHFLIRLYSDKTGKKLYDTDWINLNLTNPPSGQEISLNLSDYNLDLKQILQNLRDNHEDLIKLYLYLNLKKTDNQDIIIYNWVYQSLLGGLIAGEFNYRDWYNSVIPSFGLSETTPTPIFVKSAEFIDNTFQSVQSFITIDNDKLNNLKTSIINNLNSVIGYINGFTDALGFLKYLFYGLLIFTMIEFIVKFGRLIIPFK
jgi:hypothetical protein